MLGKYSITRRRPMISLSALGGTSIEDVIETTIKTQKTLDKILPTVEMIAEDYGKISPGVDFISKYWYTTLALIAVIGAAGSAAGAYLVLRRLEK